MSEYAIQYRSLLDEDWHFIRRRWWKSHWQSERKVRRLYSRLSKHSSGQFLNGEYRMIENIPEVIDGE